jgi:hypothetical protein
MTISLSDQVNQDPNAALRRLGEAIATTARQVWTAIGRALRPVYDGTDPDARAHRLALIHLNQSVDWTEDHLTRLLARERTHWQAVGQYAQHARLWAAITPGLTETDVLDAATDALRGRFARDWTEAEAAEVAAAYLTGYTERP